MVHNFESKWAETKPKNSLHFFQQSHNNHTSIASRGKNLHSRFMLPLACNGVVVASQSFFEVCLLPSAVDPTEMQW